MKNYLKQHAETGVYNTESSKGEFIYENKNGWYDCLIHDSLVLSHRKNDYTEETFYEGFHSHDYYEAVLFVSGNIEYVCENDVYKPKRGNVVICAPDRMHTARLLSDSTYERYVVYFKREFFTLCGKEIPLSAELEEKGHVMIEFDDADAEKMIAIIDSASECAERGDPASRFTAYGLTIEFLSASVFYTGSALASKKNEKLPENVARIKKYIDTYYSSIEGISEIASYFFYSREHASRLFRQYFNITLSEYLMQRRIAESAKLLQNGESVAAACYAVGFRSVSSYINAFRRVMGCLPSEYKKRK